MERKASTSDPNDAAAPRPETSGAGDGTHWSPLSTRTARWSWGLTAIFTAIYFVVAILTSAEFADLASYMIWGLPLGFYMGVGVIVAGLIITRIYLARIEG